MPHFDHESLRAVAPGASSSNPHGLNASEFDVARMIGCGLGLAQIAETLGFTGRAILSIRERLMQKLGASSLAQLEHILSSAGSHDWSEAIYLDDYTHDGFVLDDEDDLIFAD